MLTEGRSGSVSNPGTVFLAHLERDGRGQLLRDHLVSVSDAARGMADRIGIGAAGATIGLLHDLGKYSRDFQWYLRQMTVDQDTEQQEPKRGMIDHSTAGAQTIWRSLKSQGIQEGVVAEILAVCVASHHSGLIDCIAPSGFDNLTRRMKKADPESHFDEVWASAEQGAMWSRVSLEPDLATMTAKENWASD